MKIDLLFKGITYRYVVSKNGLVSDVLAVARKNLDIPENVIIRLNGGTLAKPNFFLDPDDTLDIRLAEMVFGSNIMDISSNVGSKIREIIKLLKSPKDERFEVFVNGQRVHFFGRRIQVGERVVLVEKPEKTKRWKRKKETYEAPVAIPYVDDSDKWYTNQPTVKG